MGRYRIVVTGLLCVGFLGGCATTQTSPYASGGAHSKSFFCTLAGAAVGGGGVAAITGGPAIAAGAAIGAALGYLACHKEERVVAAPPPEEPMDFPIVEHEPPAPPPAPPVEEKLGVITGIHFDFDKSILKPAAEPVLREVVRKMQAAPNIRARVEGHTDSIGSDEYNMRLGMRRAQAVKDALVARGIAAHRLETVSKGEREPVANNRTAAGRAQNRRVEIIGVNY